MENAQRENKATAINYLFIDFHHFSLESNQKCLHADNVAWDEEKNMFFHTCERYRCAFHPHL